MLCKILGINRKIKLSHFLILSFPGTGTLSPLIRESSHHGDKKADFDEVSI
jgi:hypothetical protein